MELSQFKDKLKGGSLAGWYLMLGEEDYLKKHYMNELRSRCISCEAFAPFNHVSFEGVDIDFGAVREAILSPPMMDEYKLIEWRFANLDSLKESERSALEELFELKEAYPYAVFAIMTSQDGLDVGTPKKPSALYKRLLRGFDVLTFDKSTDSQLLAWLKKHFDAEGVAVDAETLNALLFRSGHSMETLNNEVIKLAAYVKARGRERVTPEDVGEVASSTVECDAFALSNAVLAGSFDRALTALTDLKRRRVDPNAVIAMLEKTYSELSSSALILNEGGGTKEIESLLKFHPYKAKLYVGAAKRLGAGRIAAALAELCRMDASSKSGGISGWGAVEMFLTSQLK